MTENPTPGQVRYLIEAEHREIIAQAAEQHLERLASEELAHYEKVRHLRLVANYKAMLDKLFARVASRKRDSLMGEPQGMVWTLSTGLEYEGGHVLAAFPDPEAAAAYLESLGVRIRGHYVNNDQDRNHYLTPGWSKEETRWFAEINTDGGYGDYAMIKHVPWNPVPVSPGVQDA